MAPTKFDILKDLLAHNRSVRRFDNNLTISRPNLESIVELSTLCASGRNAQPLKYRIVDSREECDLIYPLLAWAGYYSDWDGPQPSERPTAYLIQCLDTLITPNPLCDDGLQLEALTLGATALGLNCCIIKSFKPEIAQRLNIPQHLTPRYVVALGKADEKVKIVELGSDGDFKYYRDSDDCQCVPKRSLDEILIP